MKNWTAEERLALREDVVTNALRSTVPGGRSVQDLSKDLLDIASAGLKARKRLDSFGEDEVHFLNALKNTVETGKTPADELLECYHGKWEQKIDPIFTEFAY